MEFSRLEVGYFETKERCEAIVINLRAINKHAALYQTKKAP